jgi:hypothetical protein
MDLDLQSLFGLHVYSCIYWLRNSRDSSLLQHLGSYTRTLLVSQDRRHLFVTPCIKGRVLHSTLEEEYRSLCDAVGCCCADAEVLLDDRF